MKVVSFPKTTQPADTNEIFADILVTEATRVKDRPEDSAIYIRAATDDEEGVFVATGNYSYLEIIGELQSMIVKLTLGLVEDHEPPQESPE